LKQSERKYKRIVIKIGSSLFCTGENQLDFSVFNSIADQITGLISSGTEVIIVSSGAIALGMHVLKLSDRPDNLVGLQAAAAVGQNEVINRYRNFFRDRGITVAQILLTWEDLNDRKRYLNAKNTLLALLGYRSVPIINENDTVATDEIKFGDNDRLSALVATVASADLLIILSDVDGLFGEDKKTVIPVVSEITSKIKALACPTNKKTCVGGMITKIEAAKIAVTSGIPCVIANGRKKGIIDAVINNPESSGTLFISTKGLAARKRWIAFSARTKGKIIVDEGAKKALLMRKACFRLGSWLKKEIFSAVTS